LLSRALSGFGIWLAGIVTIGAGLGVYIACSLALGAPEPLAVWSLVTHRSRALSRLRRNRDK
jgi:uncharacterized membrane protein YczE